MSDPAPDPCEHCGGAFTLTPAGRWVHQCPRPDAPLKRVPPPPHLHPHSDLEEDR